MSLCAHLRWEDGAELVGKDEAAYTTQSCRFANEKLWFCNHAPLEGNSACLEALKQNTADFFTVLCQARNTFVLDVLKALFIQQLAPELRCQKEHVRVLTLC